MFGRIAVVHGDKFVIATGVHCLGCRRESSGGAPRKDLHVSYDVMTNLVADSQRPNHRQIFEEGNGRRHDLVAPHGR